MSDETVSAPPPGAPPVIDMQGAIAEATAAEHDRIAKEQAMNACNQAAAQARTDYAAALSHERAAKQQLRRILDPGASDGIHILPDGALPGLKKFDASKVLSYVKHHLVTIIASYVILMVLYLVASHMVRRPGPGPGPGPDPGPPAPAPDDALSSAQREYFRAIVDNLFVNIDGKVTHDTRHELGALEKNYLKVVAEIQQAVAGAGRTELKDPANIEARLKELNRASIADPSRWRKVDDALAALLDRLDSAGKLKEAGDYITAYGDIAVAFHAASSSGGKTGFICRCGSLCAARYGGICQGACGCPINH